MRVRSILALGALGAALAGCGADERLTAPEGAALAVSSTRTVWVDAVTYFTSPNSGSQSGGYAKGWATPVAGGTGYQMGDVEADGTDGQDFVEQTGYTGQLDAFKYNSQCTHKWIGGAKTVLSTASTIYLANYPTVTAFRLELTCPGNA